MSTKKPIPLPEGQAELLEMIANGFPLKQILERLTVLIEAQSPGLYCSILLLDPDGIHIHPIAGPNIPTEYMTALEGFAIGPIGGSCGTAMYRKEPVIVTDVRTDPLWAPYKSLLEPHGFRSCWSNPILIDQDRVLGSFAMYYREVRSPGPRELELMAVATHIAGIAINRTYNEEALRRHQLGLEELVRERTAQLMAEKNKAESTSIALIKANQDLIASFNTLNAAQEELVRNKQLAALGSLVAGVAHELNTPIGNCVLASSKLSDETRILSQNFIRQKAIKRGVFLHYLDDVAEANEILARNLDRAANLVLSFKQIAVDQANSNRRTFNLQQTVAEILGLIQVSFQQRAFIIEEHIPTDLELDSYPGAISQVLECLVENSQIHGFEGRDRGKITVSANADKAGWINLLVQDDGIGIPGQHSDKIFDPFFTTKMGSGSLGLGLNIAHNVVIGILGGKVRVESAPETGTLVTISLPVVAPHLRNPV
ncbi:signal transduction histidine kinase [Oxalobacteraceae bacterium GrIS 2.11]